MAKGTIGGKYGRKGQEGYDLDVEIIKAVKNGKQVWELRRADNNHLIRTWQNPNSPYNYAKKHQYNII